MCENELPMSKLSKVIMLQPERFRGVFTTRRYTNPRLPLPLPVNVCTQLRMVT